MSVPIGQSSVWDSHDRVWPVLAERDRPDPKQLNGGSRADYKLFGLETPRASVMTGTMGQFYDICFCLQDCTETTANYFKIGNLRV